MRRPALSTGSSRPSHLLPAHLAERRSTGPSKSSSFASLEGGECISNGTALLRRRSLSHNTLLSLLLCNRSSASAHHCVPSFHATLFSSLARNDPSLSVPEASLFSGSAVCGARCLEQLDHYVHPTTTQHNNSTHTALLQQMRLVRLMVTPTTAAAVTGDDSSTADGALEARRECLSNALEKSQPLPKSVLSGLLKLPCHPALLRVLVQHVLRSEQGKVEADAFETMLHALFSNDNFFSLETFVSMHEMVLLILSTTQAAAVPFDFVTIKWTPLMTKWARVYAKMFKGDLLYASFQQLMAAVPEAEVKIPASFYVYLLGAVLDANVYATAAAPLTGWNEVLHVAQQALRLHGRGRREIDSIWVILLKAALTMQPPRRECERLLQAHHLCTAAERPAPMNKDSFSQMTRYMCTAVSRSGGDGQRHGPELAVAVADARALARSYSQFLLDRDDLSFLWVVNAIGVIGGELWKCFGASAQPVFSDLMKTLEKVLAARDVAGFHVENNPPLAKLMECFGVGERAAFWWTCGCGYESPSSCSHCLRCTQRRKTMWTCTACGSSHKSPCAAQRCDCGERNPRLRAAMKHDRLLCPSCGSVCDERGVCVTCKARHGAEAAVTTCTFCKATLKSHALYCPSCFTPAVGKRLSIWQCASCQGASLSTFSTCHTCGEKRRAGCFTAPFVPWHCGCGALCHPCQWTCHVCAPTGAAPARAAYTCSACGQMSGLSTAVVLDTAGWSVHVKLCEHCGEVHPRDRETLESPKLPRHCALCGTTVPPSNIFLNGGFYHCGANQWVNENMPFQCSRCDHKDEKQFGYECRFCGCPRREIAANATTFVWRCLHESGPESVPCGEWNYSWNDHCTSCNHIRAQSEWECRARSFFWECSVCHHENAPTDVCFCRHCGKGVQVPLPCDTCGRSHLALSC